jgi:hypothetical protein
MLDGLESPDPGVQDRWSPGVPIKDIKPIAITPTLPYSNAPDAFGIKIRQQGSPYFG